MRIEAEGQAKAIQIVAEAARQYFKDEAQLYKALEVANNILKDNTKYVISENILEVVKNFIKKDRES